MKVQFNLFYPEWQGYGAHQEVFHGAHHFCNHVGKSLTYDAVEVVENEELVTEGGIIGRQSLLRMMDQAKMLLQKANPTQTFMVGGTCACEVVPVSFLNEKYDNDLAVFWFDAHGDLNTAESSPSGRLHGMPLRTLLGEGDDQVLKRVARILKPAQIALVGARDLDEGEQTYIQQQKISIFKASSASHLHELVDFAKSAGFRNAYIHFDLDVLEPSEFPHVLMPVAEGVSLKNAIAGLALVREHFSVVGCSIVEYCPKDGGGTSKLSRLMNEGLGISG
ncbi:MAG: arginase family protein [Ekhidna sp.]